MRASVHEPGAVAVLREPLFSPGMVDHDAAILRAVACELVDRHGFSCPVLTVSELAELAKPPRLVLSMAEGEESLVLLERLERRGAVVVNSPGAVRATRRAALLELARPRGPLVEGALVETNDGDRIPASILEGGAAWVKRADYHALGPGDVVRVESGSVIQALRTMHARGIPRAVVQPHVTGSVVKFYGVCRRNEPFFRWFPTDGGPAPDRDSVESLRDLAFAVARSAGTGVFGGDAVISPGASPVIVDLNAWPSFWRCLADAARAIAEHAAGLLETLPARSPVA